MTSTHSLNIQDLKKTKEQLIAELEQLRSGELGAEKSNFSGFKGTLPTQLTKFLVFCCH